MEGIIIEKPTTYTTYTASHRNMASPWGKVATPVMPCSLQDVMSEQLADELHSEDLNLEW